MSDIEIHMEIDTQLVTEMAIDSDIVETCALDMRLTTEIVENPKVVLEIGIVGS